MNILLYLHFVDKEIITDSLIFSECITNKPLSKYLNPSGLTSEPVVLVSTLYYSVHIKSWILVRDYRLNIGQNWSFVW